MDKQKEIMSLLGRVSDKPNSVTDEVNAVRLHYVQGVFGCLYMDLHINGSPAIFFVDTGYAGPPVINPWHQAREEIAIEKNGEHRWKVMSLEERINECNKVSDFHQPADALKSQFADRHMCSTYASACTMRLAGIASDKRRVIDLALCPELVPSQMSSSNTRGNHPRADLLVTMALHGVTHILTLDYLQSHGNFKMEIKNKQDATLTLGPTLSPPEEWMPLHTERIHGVFAIRLKLSIQMDGAIYAFSGIFTLDSGSSAPLVLNKSFFNTLVQHLAQTPDIQIHKRMMQHPTPTPNIRFVQQTGVNGETTCAQVLWHVLIHAQDERGQRDIFVDSPVICNDTDTVGVDGYIGLELMATWKGMFANATSVWLPSSTSKLTVPSTFFNKAEAAYCRE